MGKINDRIGLNSFANLFNLRLVPQFNQRFVDETLSGNNVVDVRVFALHPPSTIKIHMSRQGHVMFVSYIAGPRQFGGITMSMEPV